MADKFFVKVLSAAVKVVRRGEGGSVVMRHDGFDQATGKPIMRPAVRAVFVEKGQQVPDDAADGEIEKLLATGAIGRKATVTVIPEAAAATPKLSTRSSGGRKTAASSPRAKATDLGKLAGLDDAGLVKVLAGEKPGVKKLLAAVGPDKELAGRLLAAEKSTGSEPRATLVAGLEKVIAGSSS